MLKIENLKVQVQGKLVLNGVNLVIEPGTVHAIMGPNGSGKSTLSHVLAGKPGYEILSGRVEFEGEDLLQIPVHERSLRGLFLGFQYPVEIPGLSNMQFLKSILNASKKFQNQPEIDAIDFLSQVKSEVVKVGLTEEFLYRCLNQGFSGGEKKRNELLQLRLLSPKLAILDELDSGLDIDALQALAHVVNEMREKSRSFLLITHYQRLLDHIRPDYIHVLKDGQMIRTGGAELAAELEQSGYAGFERMSDL